MNSQELRAALALALVYVLRMLGLFMVMPVLAVAAADYPGYSPLLVGVAIGGYGLTQAALQIPMGMLSDRWGRKPVILLGLTVFALGSFVAAYADNMYMLVAGRILQGAGAIAGAIMALATDVSRETQRAKVLAIIGIAIGFSFYIAVLLGPIIAENWGLAGVFGITGVLALLCMPLIRWVVPNSPKQAAGETLPQRGQLKRLLVQSQLWRLNVSVLILHMMITLLFVQLPVTLLNFDMTLSSHWMLYLPILSVSIVGLVIMMGISKGRTPRKMLFTAVIFMALAFALMSIQDHNWYLVIAAVVLFFTGFNYLEANFPAMVSSLSAPGEKGTAMGIYASFQFFGAFVGGLLAGVVAEHWDSSTAYGVGVIATLLWLFVLFGLREVKKLKRVMLSVDFSTRSPREIEDSLMSLPGVVDIASATDEGAVYLKVTKEFELEAARKYLTA